MLRVRRSRIFIVLAVFTLFLLIHFKSIPERWPVTVGRPFPKPDPKSPAQGNSPEDLKHEAEKHGILNDGALVKPTAKPALADSGLIFDTHAPPKPPGATPKATINTTKTKPTKPTATTTTKAAAAHVQTPAPPAQTVDADLAGAPDQYGLAAPTKTPKKIHWTKLPEHFPVPSESIIPLPRGKEQKIPRIQHNFKDETSLERSKREARQARIKKLFKKSWDGYTEHAWLHDELRPGSGEYRDPFCGWAATLVDSLDSLLILGLEEEFKHALEGLERIDFTTTTRSEIPVFETTIRYLGGLLSAYDLDPAKHKILLEKAVELAEVLMGSFDTPNRMPQTFYRWKPVFAEQPKRSGVRVVMSELGSLSMEFTRLAQLTKNDKYYDAIARITNEFEAFQDHTKIPGLWPLFLDSSGCKKSSWRQDSSWRQNLVRPEDDDGGAAGKKSAKTIVANPQLRKQAAGTVAVEPQPKKPAATKQAEPFDRAGHKGKIHNWGEGEKTEQDELHHPKEMVIKRQLQNLAGGDPKDGFRKPGKPGKQGDDEDEEDEDEGKALDVTMSVRAKGDVKLDCEPQGLASPPGSTIEDFSFGGLGDSTYEYLPKQHLLLGGQVGQYRKMYEKSIAAANKWLLFRPMTKTEEDILVLGNAKAQAPITEPGNFNLKPDLSHLLCFTGGMYGLGSRIFDRPDDLEIAKKMTDACVWAYGATNSGIMPEDFSTIPCDSKEHCPWNQTAWEYAIDPYPETRIEDGLMAVQPAKKTKKNGDKDAAADAADPEPAAGPKPERAALASPTPESQADVRAERLAAATKGALRRRDGKQGLQAEDFDREVPQNRASTRAKYMQGKEAQDGSKSGHTGTPTSSQSPAEDIMTQSEYVEFVSELRGLPPGVPFIASRKYILRPEAIESVFYMYRLTGDTAWREKGWRMFEAIERATNSLYGASAILDVTAKPDDITLLDEMESFWLAETLKYFYLLFSTEDTISLDDYVLNTEAHPFKRPAPRS